MDPGFISSPQNQNNCSLQVQPSIKVVYIAQQYSMTSLCVKKAVLIVGAAIFHCATRSCRFSAVFNYVKKQQIYIFFSLYMTMCETWIPQFTSKSKRLSFVRTFVISENRQCSEQYSLTSLSKDKVLLNVDLEPTLAIFQPRRMNFLLWYMTVNVSWIRHFTPKL